MRKKAVYATQIVGRPPMEDFYLGHATDRIFLPLLELTTPETTTGGAQVHRAEVALK